MANLNLEERGAYNTVLDLIYEHADRLVDDDKFLASWCRVDVRKWRRLKQRLIDLHKLKIVDGFIRNERASCETLAGLHRALCASNAGYIKAGKFDKVVNIPNELMRAGADAAASFPHVRYQKKRRYSSSNNSTDPAREETMSAAAMREQLADLARKRRMP